MIGCTKCSAVVLLRTSRFVAIPEVWLPFRADSLACHWPVHPWQGPFTASAILAWPVASQHLTEFKGPKGPKPTETPQWARKLRILFREMFYLLGAAVPNFDKNEGYLDSSSLLGRDCILLQQRWVTECFGCSCDHSTARFAKGE